MFSLPFLTALVYSALGLLSTALLVLLIIFAKEAAEKRIWKE